MENPLIQPNEIYLASFPFGDTAGMKLRPVLTLTGWVTCPKYSSLIYHL